MSTRDSLEKLRHDLSTIISKDRERATAEERLWNTLAALMDEIKNTLGEYTALQWCLHHYIQLNKEDQEEHV